MKEDDDQFFENPINKMQKEIKTKKTKAKSYLFVGVLQMILTRSRL